MTFAFFLTLAIALCAQRISSRVFWKLWVIADLTALLLATQLFGLLSFVSHRPLLAALGTSLTFCVLAFVNAAKKKVLRDEPLLFTDATLIPQVFRYPALYLPFLPWKGLLFFLALCIPLSLVLGQVTIGSFLAHCLLLPSLPLILLFLCAKTKAVRAILIFLARRSFLTFDPARDEARIGPLAMALSYTLWYRAFEGRDGIRGPVDEPFAKTLWTPGIRARFFEKKGALPHIILIQEESFCDPRLYLSGYLRDLLPNYDAMRESGGLCDLAVHAFGAYTMRTEYEVLSGFEPTCLSCDRFHPYVRLRRLASWSIARDCARMGYHTLCIHPYARGFFYRDRALPNLGFQRFVSLEDWPARECFGPYVSDMSVARRILAELGDRPTFCFVITMENHGPWTKERLCGTAEVQRFQEFSRISESLPPYLTHIANADRFLGHLRVGLTSCGRDAVLAFYGDHLPAIPALIPKSARHTPCLFWSTDGLPFSLPEVLPPARLAGILLETIVARQWKG